MFGLFRNKKSIKVTDFVWKREKEKFSNIVELVKKTDAVTLLYFFHESKTELIHALNKAGITVNEDNTISNNSSITEVTHLLKHSTNRLENKVCFIEHHPSFQTESAVLNHLFEHNVKEVDFYISLEDPLLRHFLSERIITLLEKMGYQDDEVIQHDLISKSIVNAQKKIDEKIQFPSTASSATSWFKLNIPTGSIE